MTVLPSVWPWALCLGQGGMGEGAIVVGMWLYCCLVFSGNVFNFVVKFINVRFFFLLLKRSLLPRFWGDLFVFIT